MIARSRRFLPWLLALLAALFCASCGEVKLANAGRAGLECRTIEEVFALHAEEVDIGHAALLLDREIDPEIDLEGLRLRLDRMGRQLLRRVRWVEDREQLATVLIQTVGLHGRWGVKLEYDRDSERLQDVLVDRKGDCCALSMLYLAVAERAGVEVHGVCAPLHVYVRLLTPGGAVEIEPTAHSYFPEAREDLWFFSERDREAVPHGRDLDRREAVAVYAIQVALELEDHARAIELCSLAGEAFPDSYLPHMAQASVWAKSREWALAIRHLEHVVSLRPDNANAWGDLARVHAERREWESALSAIDRALAIDDRFTPYWLIRAEILDAAERPRESLEAIESALCLCLEELHPFRKEALLIGFGGEVDVEDWAWSLAASAYLARSSRTMAALDELDGHRDEAHGAKLATIDRDTTLCRLALVITGGLSTEGGGNPESLAAIEESIAEDPRLGESHAVQRFLRRAREVCSPPGGD